MTAFEIKSDHSLGFTGSRILDVAELGHPVFHQGQYILAANRLKIASDDRFGRLVTFLTKDLLFILGLQVNLLEEVFDLLGLLLGAFLSPQNWRHTESAHQERPAKEIAC